MKKLSALLLLFAAFVVAIAQAIPNNSPRTAVAKWQKAWNPQIAYDQKLSRLHPEIEAWKIAFRKRSQARNAHLHGDEYLKVSSMYYKALRGAEKPIEDVYTKVYARFMKHTKDLRDADKQVLNALADKLKNRLGGKTQNEIADFWFSKPGEDEIGGIGAVSGNWSGLAYLLRDRSFAPFFAVYHDMDGGCNLCVMPVYRIRTVLDKDSVEVELRSGIRDVVLVGFLLDLVSYNSDVCLAEDFTERYKRAQWIERHDLIGLSDGVRWPSPQRSTFFGEIYAWIP